MNNDSYIPKLDFGNKEYPYLVLLTGRILTFLNTHNDYYSPHRLATHLTTFDNKDPRLKFTANNIAKVCRYLHKHELIRKRRSFKRNNIVEFATKKT